MRRVLARALLTSAALAGFAVRAHAESFAEGLRLEIGGVYGSISSEEVGEILRVSGWEDLDHLAGFSVGVRRDVTEHFGVSVASGYLWDSTNEVRVNIAGPPVGTGDAKFELSSVPVSVGVDFRVASGATALVLEAGVGTQHVKLISVVEPHEGVDSPRVEQHWSEDAMNAFGGVAAEWHMARTVVAGARVGYRFSEKTEFVTSFYSTVSPDGVYTMDPSGAYASVFVAVAPWAKP